MLAHQALTFITLGLIGLCTSIPAPSPATTPPPAKSTFGCLHEADPDGAQGFCPAVAATGWCVCSDSSTYAIETSTNGPCGYTTTPAQGPTVLATTDCATTPSTSITSATATSTSTRNKCSTDECPKFCDLGSDSTKRSFLGFGEHSETENSLDKRFYENSDPDKFPYALLAQSYTRNICPTKPLKNTFIWKPFSETAQSAAGLQGLSGCTTIFILLSKGAFSSHIWEEDKANDPPRDLQPANYKATLADLATGLGTPNVPEVALSGGQAWIVIPNDPENPANLLYPQNNVDALTSTIETATGITSNAPIRYTQEDWETSTVLGTNKLGTASSQYDPKYADPNNDNKVGKAYRVIVEGALSSQRTGF